MGRSVLIVDDSVVIRTFIRGYLPEEGGYTSLEAANGLEAVEAYRKARPDLVFLDLTMPVMDGVTALARIMEMDPTARVVVVTADVQPKSVQRVLDMGAVKVLKKPPIKEEVRAALQLMEAP